MSIITNTEFVDSCEPVQHLGDRMEDYYGKEIVLDSEDEGGDQNDAVNMVNDSYDEAGEQNEAVNMVNDSYDEAGEQNCDVNMVDSECFSAIGKSSGRDTIGLGKRQKTPTGYFRRLGNKVTAQMYPHNLARSSRCYEESNAGRTCVSYDSRYQNDSVVVDSILCESPDQERCPVNAEKSSATQEYLNIIRESMTYDSLDEKFMSSHKSNTLDMEKDGNDYFEHAKLNYVESQVSLELQGNALHFVDHYLSVSELGLSKDLEAKKTNKIKSPPALRSKGPQSLARRISFGYNARKSMAFDWAPKQYENEYRSGRICLSKESDTVRGTTENISNFESKDKFPGSILNPNDLDENPMHFNEIGIVGVSMQNVEEIEQLEVTPDAFNVGLDTQIAAEAMEALIYATPPKIDASFTIVERSPNTVNKKSKSKKNPNPYEAFSCWRNKEKRSKCVKITSVELYNDVSCSMAGQYKKPMGTDPKFPVSTNSETGKELSDKNPGITRSSKPGRPPKSLSKSIEYKGYNRWSKDTCDVIKSNTPPERRKLINTNHDTCKIGANEKCLNLKSESSFHLASDKAKKERNLNLHISETAPSKLNICYYRKGKRAHQRDPRHSIRSCYQSLPFVPTNKDNAEKCPVLLVYTRRRKLLSERKHTGSSLKIAIDMSSPSLDNKEFSDRQLPIPDENDKVKPATQLYKLDDGRVPSSFGTPGNMMLDELSNGNSKTLQVCEGTEENKHLFRSSLTKELKRLGDSKTLLNFLPKDSSRRRATRDIHVLFSQNLEINILKRQKKIVARFGFSIASCCSDATHFVTDRFVRTRNLMEAIALGKYVVTHLWLESCEQAGYIVDEKTYIMRDEKREKEIEFSLPLSLARARQHPLLKSLHYPKCENWPYRDEIQCLVKAVHGQVIKSIHSAKMKNKVIPGDLLILSSEEDYSICIPFLEKGTSIYSSELLLNGIVTQKLEYERHQLFKDFSRSSSSRLS